MEGGPSGARWLRWIKRLQAIAQDGLTYSSDDYDLGRYEQLRELAAEMLAAHSTGTLDEARNLLTLETGPATPKVDVRAAVFRDGRILLVKEPDEVGWSVPGGWADVGESPSEAAARETLEESGYSVRPVRILAAYDRDRHGHPPIAYHVYKLVYLCEILDDNPLYGVDTDEARFSQGYSPIGLPLARSRASVECVGELYLVEGGLRGEPRRRYWQALSPVLKGETRFGYLQLHENRALRS